MKRKIFGYSALFAALLLLSGGSPAIAAISLTTNAPFGFGDTVAATLTYSQSLMGTGGTALKLYSDPVVHNDSGPNTTLQENWSSNQGGLLGWTNVSVNGHDLASNVTFNTACVEVLQNVYWGGQATWVVKNLADSPRPAAVDGSPMGSVSAGLIQDLYKQYGGVAASDSLHAGAFQMAIWKIEYDYPTQGSGNTINANFAAGRMIASPPNGNPLNTNTEAGLAKQWLDSLYNHGDTSVYALTSDTFQDQAVGIIVVPNNLFQAVPEPASLIVWSLLAGGSASLAVARRRRQRPGRWSRENREAILAVIGEKIQQ